MGRRKSAVSLLVFCLFLSVAPGFTPVLFALAWRHPLDSLLLVLHGALLLGVLAGATVWLCGQSRLKRSFSLRFALLLLVLGGSSFFAWDYLGYIFLRMHFADAAGVLVENYRMDPRGMRRFFTYAAVAVGGSTLVIGLLAAYLARACASAEVLAPERPRHNRGYLLLALVAAFFLEAYGSRWWMSPEGYELRQHSLFSSRLLGLASPAAPPGALVIPHPQFSRFPTAETVDSALATLNPGSIASGPPILIFVVESLRADVITPEVAPRLAEFARQCLPIERAYSGGNCTHISWASILLSINPFFWSAQVHRQEHAGSLPLRILRRCGYQVHCFSTPSLRYFNLDHTVFGERLELADSMVDQFSYPFGDAGNNADVDAWLIGLINQQVGGLQGNARDCCLCFLDSPHYDYRWPKSFKPPFSPVIENPPVNPNGVGAQERGLFWNRYRNAVRFVDTQLGSVFDALKAASLFDQAIIVVTGDHGEEFLEEDHWLHSTTLNEYQLRVPLLIKLPSSYSGPRPPGPILIGSHARIFPTIIQSLGVQGQAPELLGARSLLDSSAPSFSVSAQCNSATPPEVVICTPDEICRLSFQGQRKLGALAFAERATLRHWHAASLAVSAAGPILLTNAPSSAMRFALGTFFAEEPWQASAAK